MHLGVEIRVGQTPLPPARKPDPTRTTQRGHEGFAVGHVAVGRVQHDKVRGTRVAKRLQPRVRLIVGLGTARGRYHDNR